MELAMAIPTKGDDIVPSLPSAAFICPVMHVQCSGGVAELAAVIGVFKGTAAREMPMCGLQVFAVGQGQVVVDVEAAYRLNGGVNVRLFHDDVRIRLAPDEFEIW